MRKALALLALFAAPAFATGTTANVSWVAPTTYTDSTALPATDIASYTVTWKPETIFAKTGTATAAAPLLYVQVTSLQCGKYDFTITAKTTATAYSPNAVSAPGGPVVYDTGVACAAPLPGSITLTVK